MRVDLYITITDFKRRHFVGEGTAQIALRYKSKVGREYKLDLQEKMAGTGDQIILQAIIKGMKRIVKPCEVVIHAGKNEVRTAVETGWLAKWAADGYRRAKGKELKNKTYWQQLKMLMEIYSVRFVDN